MIKDAVLLDFITKTQLLSREDIASLRAYAAEHRVSLESALVSTGLLSQKQTAKLLGYLSQTQFVDLSKKQLRLEDLARVPEPLAREHAVVCFQSFDGGEHLHIACRRLEDVDALKNIASFARKTITPYLADEQDIYAALKTYQDNVRVGLGAGLERALRGLRPTHHIDEFLPNVDPKHVQALSEDSSAKLFVSALFALAHNSGAQTVDCIPERDSVLVNFVIEGRNYKALRIEKSKWHTLVMKFKLMADYPLHKPVKSFSRTVANSETDHYPWLHFVFVPTDAGLRVSIDLETEASRSSNLVELFPKSEREYVLDAVHQGHGMVLLAGKQKSGMTSARYGLMSYLARTGVDVISFEEVPEYDIPGVSQITTKKIKNTKSLIEHTIALRPGVLAFDKSIDIYQYPLFSLSKKLLVLNETDNIIGDLTSIIFKQYEGFGVDTPLWAVNNVSFVDISGSKEKKSVRLSDKELGTLRKYLGTEELQQVLFGSIDSRKDPRSINFATVKNRKSIKSKIDSLLGTERVFVRSVADLSGLARRHNKAKNLGALEKDTRFALDQSMLRAALPYACSGEIDVKELLERLRS